MPRPSSFRSSWTARTSVRSRSIRWPARRTRRRRSPRPFTRTLPSSWSEPHSSPRSSRSLATLLLARRLTRPLGTLATAAERVERGDLTVRVPLPRDAESHELATAFNQMAEHLERSETLRRQSASDLAHELATPVTVLTGSAPGDHGRPGPDAARDADRGPGRRGGGAPARDRPPGPRRGGGRPRSGGQASTGGPVVRSSRGPLRPLR